MPASAPGPQSEPIAAADVAATFAEVAAGSPLSGTLDVGGPGTYTLDELGGITLTFKGHERSVTVDDTAGMFAAAHGDVLTTKKGAHIAPTHYTDWLK